jgi:hypothetical protein
MLEHITTEQGAAQWVDSTNSTLKPGSNVNCPVTQIGQTSQKRSRAALQSSRSSGLNESA